MEMPTEAKIAFVFFFAILKLFCFQQYCKITKKSTVKNHNLNNNSIKKSFFLFNVSEPFILKREAFRAQFCDK